ncbi:MAG: ABC transporter ATP-binding protein/permease [Puniceicoccales bacterium]|nr:ABC transporter ATP-binding protein/permease [Puniceicoccales bacterium]
MNRELIQFFWRILRPYRWLAVLGILFTAPVGALDAAIAAFLRPCIDGAIVNRSIAFTARVPLLIVLFTFIQGVCIYFSSYVNGWVGNRITFDTKKLLIHRLFLQNATYFDGTDSGQVLMRFSTDASTACAGLVLNVRYFLTRFFSSLSLVVVLLYNSWWLALIALIFVAIAFYPLRFMRRKMKGLVGMSQTSGAAETAFCHECHAGNRTVAAYNLQWQLEERYGDLMEEMFRVSLRMIRHSSWPSPVMHLIVSVGLAGVLGLGSYLVTAGLMSSGSFVAFIAALLLIYTPIKGIGTNVAGIQGAFLAAERVCEVLRRRPAVPLPDRHSQPLAFREGIEFRNVHFFYRPDRPVLRGIDLFVTAGEKVGIVGHSGSGKSTLIHLLLRLYDVSCGSISIDGNDVRRIPIGDLRQSIAIVFQDNFLFSGTVRKNILLGNPWANERELRAAVDAALLGDFVQSLPNGLDTEVGERGVLLSGGQRQRIAIARAIIKNAPIVVLDEATSALDSHSEAIVQRALDNLARNRTVFIIAHRISTVAAADRILVLNDGRVVECGTHNELLARRNGIYASLHRQQSSVRKVR